VSPPGFLLEGFRVLEKLGVVRGIVGRARSVSATVGDRGIIARDSIEQGLVREVLI